MIANMPSLAFVEPVVSVPSCDLFVFVVLNFEHHAGFEDELAAAIFKDHDIAALDPQALANGGGQGDLTATGHDERRRHVSDPR